jgi:glycosyltransferase involved in cell wall biosynthesis
MSILIFGDSFSFPDGNAATNRVHTYAKGFYENGVNVQVICFANDYVNVVDGELNGINFYHTFGQKSRHKYFIIRRWQKFIKYFRTIRLIGEINKSDKIIALNCWAEHLHFQIFAFIIAKYFNTKFILERSEHPFKDYEDSFIKLIFGNIKLYFEISFCSGIFCISRHLVEFYKNRGFNPQKLFLVPSTVDPTRFVHSGEKIFPFPFIGYFGSLTFTWDNIDILIKAFAKISNKFPEIRLVLGGFCLEDEKKQLKDLIKELNITTKVELLKYLKREEIVNYINQAHILVLVRKNNTKSQASFPSKLTEFLVTANPVISVNVGEISDYLTDGENAFLVKPGDFDALAEKLIFVLENYQFAKEVGLRGKELTNTVFNYKFQAKRMLDFINTF